MPREFVKEGPGKWMFFVTPEVTEDDKEAFFGPLDGTEVFTVIEDHWIMAHIMHAVGIFTSVGQARKNGHNKPIPKGWTDKIVGKKKYEISIFNPFSDDELNEM